MESFLRPSGCKVKQIFFGQKIASPSKFGIRGPLEKWLITDDGFKAEPTEPWELKTLPWFSDGYLLQSIKTLTGLNMKHAIFFSMGKTRKDDKNPAEFCNEFREKTRFKYHLNKKEYQA